MVERADLLLSTFELLAVLSLVAVRMVKLFDGRVSAVAQQSFRAMRDVAVLADVLAVLWHVVEDAWWPPEVSHVVCVQAVLRVM